MQKIIFLILISISPFLALAGEEDKDQGTCLSAVHWRVNNKKQVSQELFDVSRPFDDRVGLIYKQIASCTGPQGNFLPECIKKKLSTADYDFLLGYYDGQSWLKTPEDSSKLAIHERIVTGYCGQFLIQNALKRLRKP
jgi:hypothetical protein